MITVRLPTKLRGADRSAVQAQDHDVLHHETHVEDGAATELVDLYKAIAIAVPLAFLLKWLWP